MKQTHLLIVGTCIVSLGLGYVAGSNGSAPGPGGKEGASSTERRERSTSRARPSRENDGGDVLAGILRGRSPAELSAEDLAKLIPELSRYDPSMDGLTRTRQMYQFQLLLSKLSASQLESAADLLSGDLMSRQYGGLSSIVSAMCAKDPARTLAWANDREENKVLLSSVISSIAKEDPQKAAELYKDHLMKGGLGRNFTWEAGFGIGSAMAKLGKKPLLEFVDSLPLQQQSNILSNACRELPEGDRAAMLDEMYSRSKDGRMNEWNFSNLFTNMIGNDPNQAFAWLSKMEPGEERAALELSQAASLAMTGNEAGAREVTARAIAQMPGREKELIKNNNMGTFNGAAEIIRYASLLPEGVELVAEDLKNQARGILYQDLGGLADFAGALRNPTEQVKLVTGVLDELGKSGGYRNQMNATDFDILEARIGNLKLTGENQTRVMESLAAAREANLKPIK